MRVAGSSRLRSASSVAALVAGGLILALVVIDVPLARLAHQSLNASGGSSPVWFSAALGVVGFVVASRRPRNPLGWIMLASAAVSSLSQDASFYMVADYRIRHGGLPLGWVAVLAQPGWAVSIVLTGLAVLLFPAVITLAVGPVALPGGSHAVSSRRAHRVGRGHRRS